MCPINPFQKDDSINVCRRLKWVEATKIRGSGMSWGTPDAVSTANMQDLTRPSPGQQSGLMLHRTLTALHPPADLGDQCHPCSSRRSGARAWRLCSKSSLMEAITGYPHGHRRVSPPSAPSRALKRSDATSRRLDPDSGIGPALATALVASVPGPRHSAQHGTSQPGSGSCRRLPLSRLPTRSPEWLGP